MGIKQEKYFWLQDGTAIKNLFELANSLAKMPKKAFSYHVTKEKNDFSMWVRDVIKDKELAEKIDSIKTAKTMGKYIKERLKPSQKKAKLRAKRKISGHIVKKANEPSKTKIKDVMMSKIKNFVFIDEDKKKEMKTVRIEPSKIKLGTACPYKSYKCSFLEFLVGIVVGLIAGLFLTGII